MKKDIYTTLGARASDEEVVKAVAEYVAASDACAAAASEDYGERWLVCNKAIERLDEYFTTEAVEGIIFGKDAIRRFLEENLKR